MAIVLNGSTGITAPDINVTAQATDITTTGDITAVDATLSGGVYLGGTGSANYLDDYEEGTWTPTAATNSGSASSFTTIAAENTYTKVGNLVTLIGNVTDIDTTGTTSTAQFQISGLPFTPKSSNSGYFGTARYAKLSLQGGRTQVVTEVNASLNVLRFASVGGSNTDVTTVDHGDITDDQADFTFLVHYLTDS